MLQSVVGKLLLMATLATLLHGMATGAEAAEVLGRRSRVIHSPELRPIAEHCAAAIDSAIPVLEAMVPFEVPKKVKIVLRIFGNSSDYVAAVGSAAPGAIRRAGACTNIETLESYVVVIPRGEPLAIAAVRGLSECMRFNILHEAAHQWLFNSLRGGSAIDWPSWYVEGAADTIAEACLTRESSPPGLPLLVVEDRVAHASDSLDQGSLVPLAALLTADFSKVTARHLHYVSAHSFYKFLAQDSKRFADFTARLHNVAGSHGATDAERCANNVDALRAALNHSYGDLAQLERDWHSSIRRGTARWRLHRGFSEFVAADELVTSAPAGSDSVLLSCSLPRGGSELAISSEVKIVAVGGEQADVHLEGTNGLKVSMGQGKVTLLAFDGGAWEEKATITDVAAVRAGAWFSMRVVVDGSLVVVEVGGRQVLRAPRPAGHDVVGKHWGVGARDGVVHFRSLRASGG